jgi:hypothetical protein
VPDLEIGRLDEIKIVPIPQIGLDKVSSVVAPDSAERDRPRPITPWLDHVERRQPFGKARDPCQPGIDKQPQTILH